ncbi:hypothetical protein [Jeongeupia chitinilytica]|uniref:Uncharacterized protein n=1 Tax=Jeongeupia chitinilytica TaxID=1041641 RepID=A0ABQ3GXY3_9NEIS|nr:hypothetical protein [Jeongeupia chitinilytica]GHD58026.1 hypothetical protein GCM10007350_07230 [Jeongeupia chitinilytica]
MTARRTDPGEPPLDFGDRLACAALGGLFGALYGLLLALLLMWLFAGRISLGTTIAGSAALFAVIGFIRGPVVGDLLGALAHFWYGIFNGLADYTPDTPPHDTERTLKTLFYFGFATGALIWLAL